MSRQREHSALEIALRTQGIERYLQTHPTLPIYLIEDNTLSTQLAGAHLDRVAAIQTTRMFNEHLSFGNYAVAKITARQVLDMANGQDEQKYKRILEYLIAAHLPKSTHPK